MSSPMLCPSQGYVQPNAMSVPRLCPAQGYVHPKAMSSPMLCPSQCYVQPNAMSSPMLCPAQCYVHPKAMSMTTSLQMSFIMTITTMVTRLDAYSVIYGLFLGVLMLFSRKQRYYVWLGYISLLVIMLIVQYLSCVGVPGFLCFGWTRIHFDYSTNFVHFLFYFIPATENNFNEII